MTETTTEKRKHYQWHPILVNPILVGMVTFSVENDIKGVPVQHGTEDAK